MKQFAPWVLVAVALAAIFPAVKLQEKKKPADGAEQQVQVKEDEEKQESSEPEAANPCKPEEQGDLEFPWCEPLRVLRDFYGLMTVPEKSPENGYKEILEEAKTEASGYRLKFLVALVPDPVESQNPLGLDSALDAIQKGFAEEGYLFDRYWLPWVGEMGKKDHLYRISPGILLFRRDDSQSRRLAVVFLVGESPKAGIHKRAFRQALEIASGLRGATEEPRIEILGPSFSGSVDSLLMALRDWRRDGNNTPFRIASGSATAAGLKTRFENLRMELEAKGAFGGLTFCRTVVPDHLLQEKAFQFLRERMGWDLRKAAFLSESDTGYGRGPSGISKRIVRVRFPSGISDIRNAWKRREQDRRARDRDLKVGDSRISTSREALDISLQDRDKALDALPRFSPLSTLARDQELSILLETISRDGIRYVGVLATDLKDRLFVMEKVHQFSPDTVLFTFDNDLLLGHVEYSDVTDGLLVISSSPLFTEGASWLPRTSWGRTWERRQFLGEIQQGMFEAVRYLLDTRVQATPQVWISVVGNGSLWPMAQLPLRLSETSVLCRNADSPLALMAPAKGLSDDEGGLAGKANLQIIFFAVGLCLASIVLRRAGLMTEAGADGRTLRRRPVNRPLLTLGAAILALSAAVLLVVASISEWAPYLSFQWDISETSGLKIGFLCSLVAIYVYLCVQTMGAATRGGLSLFKGTFWTLGILLSPFLLVWLVFVLWMPNGEIAFFQLRARAYTSGLSPIVSLTLLGGAAFVWIACELRRRWLTLRQGTNPVPLKILCKTENPVLGCKDQLAEIRTLLEGIFPQGWRPWLLLVSVALPMILLLWETFQPITETRNYGRVFLISVVVTASLAALSFYRFIRIWVNLSHILRRLDHISPKLAKTFRQLAPEIDWKPMRSFGFRIPPFKMLLLSVTKLQELLSSGLIYWVDARQLQGSLAGVFEQEGRGLQGGEILHRRNLEATFAQASHDLERFQSWTRIPAVREFLAVRIAAYLRYVFAHLRNSLIGAMGTGLLLLLAVSAYAFEPKSFVSLVIWMSLAAAAIWTLWIFVQMDRNPTLSRIGGTDEGQVTFDRTFFTNLFLYGAIPALGVIATQFPDVGRVLGQLVDPLLRVTGGG